jgi:hypothetical protein
VLHKGPTGMDEPASPVPENYCRGSWSDPSSRIMKRLMLASSPALSLEQRAQLFGDAARRSDIKPLHVRGAVKCNWPRGVSVSTLDSESSDPGSSPTSMTGILVLCSLDMGLAFPRGRGALAGRRLGGGVISASGEVHVVLAGAPIWLRVAVSYGIPPKRSSPWLVDIAALVRPRLRACDATQNRTCNSLAKGHMV